MTTVGDADLDTPRDADARRLAIEAVASLVYIKKTAADQVLRRAEVPKDLIRRLLAERDPASGDKRSKRDAGALVLNVLARSGQDHAVVRNIVAIAADWTAFHLAQNEYQARAVVQKARELRWVLAAADEREQAGAEERREATPQQRGPHSQTPRTDPVQRDRTTSDCSVVSEVAGLRPESLNPCLGIDLSGPPHPPAYFFLLSFGCLGSSCRVRTGVEGWRKPPSSITGNLLENVVFLHSRAKTVATRLTGSECGRNHGEKLRLQSSKREKKR